MRLDFREYKNLTQFNQHLMESTRSTCLQRKLCKIVCLWGSMYLFVVERGLLIFLKCSTIKTSLTVSCSRGRLYQTIQIITTLRTNDLNNCFLGLILTCSSLWVSFLRNISFCLFNNLLLTGTPGNKCSLETGIDMNQS